MASNPKNNLLRGKNFEREIVKLATSYGFESHRTYASKGSSEGLPDNVDVVIDMPVTNIHIQCKRSMAVSQNYLPDDNVFAQAIRQDGDKQSYVVLKTEKFMELIKLKFISEKK